MIHWEVIYEGVADVIWRCGLLWLMGKSLHELKQLYPRIPRVKVYWVMQAFVDGKSAWG